MLSPAVPILTYHQVTPHPQPTFRKYTVTVRKFAAQMQWLALNGYVSITLDMLLDQRRGRVSLPRRPVIITFDDGFQDCLDHAIPILKRHGFTAMFYLVAGLMGQISEWLYKEVGAAFPLMDWDAARQLEAAGFQCGAHSLTHPRLANMDVMTCRTELRYSRMLLEDQLGHEVRHLAYPFGSFNDTVLNIATDSGYHSACSTQIGLSTSNDDLMALHRVPIKGKDTLLDFISRLHTARRVRELFPDNARDALQRLRTIGIRTS